MCLFRGVCSKKFGLVLKNFRTRYYWKTTKWR